MKYALTARKTYMLGDLVLISSRFALVAHPDDPIYRRNEVQPDRFQLGLTVLHTKKGTVLDQVYSPSAHDGHTPAEFIRRIFDEIANDLNPILPMTGATLECRETDQEASMFDPPPREEQDPILLNGEPMAPGSNPTDPCGRVVNPQATCAICGKETTTMTLMVKGKETPPTCSDCMTKALNQVEESSSTITTKTGAVCSYCGNPQASPIATNESGDGEYFACPACKKHLVREATQKQRKEGLDYADALAQVCAQAHGTQSAK